MQFKTRVLGKASLRKVTFEQIKPLKNVKKKSYNSYLNKEFQAKGLASSKALGYEHAWYV